EGRKPTPALCASWSTSAGRDRQEDLRLGAHTGPPARDSPASSSSPAYQPRLRPCGERFKKLIGGAQGRYAVVTAKTAWSGIVTVSTPAASLRVLAAGAS